MTVARLAFVRLWVVAALFALLGAEAFAQVPGDPPDPQAWQRLAERAEMMLEAEDTPSVTLDRVRGDIAAWRETFLEAQSANETRLQTLRGQIEALGPAPEEGATEAEEIAQRRAELNEQLSALEAPRRTADEAYTRADGLIAEINEVIRSRQADELLQIGPSPLLPTSWAAAYDAVAETITETRAELSRNWNSSFRRSEMRRAAPATLGLLLLAGGLFLRGRAWMERLTARAVARQREEGRDALVFAVSLGQAIVPFAGSVALVAAVQSTSMAGPKISTLVGVIPLMTLAVFGGAWLGARVFPKSDAISAPVELGEEQRTEGRWYSFVLGVLLAVAVLLQDLAEFDEHGLESLGVLSFPLVVVAGIVLFRLGQFLLRSSVREKDGEGEPEDGAGIRLGILRLLGRALLLVGVAGPVLAGVGYVMAAEALMFPTVLTLSLISFIAVLHAPIRDIYGVVMGKTRDEARDALIPVLVTFLFTLAAVPVAALIWGVRTTELLEVWARIREGVALGETRIAPEDFLSFVVIFGIGYAITRGIQSTLRTTVLPRTKLDAGGRNAVTSGTGYLGIFLAGLAAITAAGIDLSSFALIAGALGVGIGFGLQNIVSNFISGIILLIERPIGEGDWIEVGGQMGIVKDISVRSTRIETFDRTDVIVPNADLISGTVTNWTRGNLVGRVTVSVGVAYSCDSVQVARILQEICEAHPMVSMNPAPRVAFRRFGADSLEFDCFCILRDVNFKLIVHSELNHEIHRRFREEGIEIPFAQRDVWLRNPEALVAREERPFEELRPETEPDPEEYRDLAEDPGESEQP